MQALSNINGTLSDDQLTNIRLNQIQSSSLSPSPQLAINHTTNSSNNRTINLNQISNDNLLPMATAATANPTQQLPQTQPSSLSTPFASISSSSVAAAAQSTNSSHSNVNNNPYLNNNNNLNSNNYQHQQHSVEDPSSANTHLFQHQNGFNKQTNDSINKQMSSSSPLTSASANRSSSSNLLSSLSLNNNLNTKNTDHCDGSNSAAGTGGGSGGSGDVFDLNSSSNHNNQGLNGNINNNSINNINNNQTNQSNNSNNNSNNNNGNNENYHNGSGLDVSSQRSFTNGQKDILRLIGQHLRYLGLNKTTEILINESGCMLEHPVAANFCNLIMNGLWDEAERALNSLKPIMEDSGHEITNMKFLILEQKYLECLEDGKILEALKCLRDELAPLKFNIDRLHELSSFLMCTDQMNLKTLSKWGGKSASSRQNLMDKLQSFLPPHVMLPPRRLEALLNQSIDYQCEKCPYHNSKDKGSIDSWSFLRDHVCTKDDFPTVTLQILNDHCDEVWMCKFSNNGKKLATGSKDGCLFIWDVDPVTYKLTLNKCYEEHTCGIGWVTWSPDDHYLIACGPEESTELWIWDIENKCLKKRINNNHDDSLTYAAWLPDGQTFVTGGIKGQFYYCDLDGNIRDTWEGIRVKFLQTLPDGLVLAADSLKRIRSYNFKEISDANLIQEDYQIMSFALNKSANLVLISLANQGLHLWDIKDRVLVHRYQGAIQNNFTSYGTFGGVDENFIASGSEDARVYIWNKRNEHAICILEGHTRNVSCVTWNPVYLGMIASASDDGTVRIWGPKCKLSTNSSNTTTTINGNSVQSELSNHNLNVNNNNNNNPSVSNSINSNSQNFHHNLISNSVSNATTTNQIHNLASASSHSTTFASFSHTNTPPPPPPYNSSTSSTQQASTTTNTATTTTTTSTTANPSSNNRSDRSTPV